jgi:hypothetical protein
MKTPLTFAVAALLCGCATIPSIYSWTPEVVAQKSKAKRDDFKKVTSVNSPEVLLEKSDIVDFQKVSLTAQLEDGGSPAYFVVIHTQRGYGRSAAIWREAYDQDGKRFHVVSEDVGFISSRSSIIAEIVSANVSREYLEGASEGQATWKLYGQRDELQFTLATNLVKGFMMRCDSTFAN